MEMIESNKPSSLLNYIINYSCNKYMTGELSKKHLTAIIISVMTSQSSGFVTIIHWKYLTWVQMTESNKTTWLQTYLRL